MTVVQKSPSAEGTSLAVVEAVAEAEGVSPVELTPPLYETIDPEALDILFRDDERDVVVEFAYRGHRVTVNRNGHVSVEEPKTEAGDELL